MMSEDVSVSVAKGYVSNAVFEDSELSSVGACQTHGCTSRVAVVYERELQRCIVILGI